MAQYHRDLSDHTFSALSDANRRGVLEHLMQSDASITQLAERFHMTLTGMKKHVGLLEEAGLVTTQKLGRVRMCRIGPRPLQDEAQWIARYQQVWAARFAGLDSVLERWQEQEEQDGHHDKGGTDL